MMETKVAQYASKSDKPFIDSMPPAGFTPQELAARLESLERQMQRLRTLWPELFVETVQSSNEA
jgi:hypothetical protein